MRFCFKTKVVIIYGFVKIIYSVCLPSRKQHKKAWKCHLPELRVTTPTNSDKFSTPNKWRKKLVLELVSLKGTEVVNWSSRTASNRYYVLMMICCLCCFLT